LTVYADSSFFASLYAIDRHSGAARELVQSRHGVWFTPLHHAEWFHAITQQAFHRRISREDAQHFFDHLEADLVAKIWVETPMPEGVYEVCTELARRYGPRLGVRTLDSLHVASALQLKAEWFWTFDERQAKLAKASGLKTS